MTWNPIETAPRDGTEIILYREGWFSAPIGRWGKSLENGPGFDDMHGWVLGSASGVIGFGEAEYDGLEKNFLGWDYDFMPTHWMPLPLNPQSIGGKEMSHLFEPGTWYARERGCTCPDPGTSTSTVVSVKCRIHGRWFPPRVDVKRETGNRKALEGKE